MRNVIAGVLSVVLGIGPGFAQDSVMGRDLFLSFCATCHGTDARGDGPMAAILDVLPADLTQLQDDNGGTFPVIRVAQRIDGRDPILAHGGPMPLFGELFEGDDVPIRTETGQPMITSRTIADLLAWLETIQE